MSEAARAEVEAFINTVEDKIQKLVHEFAEGSVNREVFQRLYERYLDHLDTSQGVLETEDWSAFYTMRNADSSMRIRRVFTGHAIGMIVFHHQSGTFLETMGNFDLPETTMREISTKLNSISEQITTGKFIDYETQHLGANDWLLYEPGKYTTVVARFDQEPSLQQANLIDRLHHDFETANRQWLEQKHVNAYQLAYPFIAFIKQQGHSE